VRQSGTAWLEALLATYLALLARRRQLSPCRRGVEGEYSRKFRLQGGSCGLHGSVVDAPVLVYLRRCLAAPSSKAAH
jgi:hypothetical protein